MWHYQLGAQQLGPVTLPALASMIQNATITPATLVWTPSMPQWAPAASVPQLAGLFNPTAANAKPGKVQALAIITLVSGCLNAIWGLYICFHVALFGVITFGLGCVFIVVPIYLWTVAALEIIYATKILPTPMKTNRTAQVIPILQMICAISCNPLALAAGILSFVFNNDPEVKAYFAATPIG
jgi:hypothetical protein